MLYRCVVASRHEINTTKQKSQLIAAFYNGVAEDAEAADCFDPHYAVRAIKGKKIVDILVCFDCGGVEVHYGDKEGSSSISRTPRAVFDRIFKATKAVYSPWQPPVQPSPHAPQSGGGITP